MPLKLDVLGQQIEQMTRAAVAEDRNGALERARQLMESVDPVELRAKLDERTVRLPWLVADVGDSLASAYAPAPCPANHSVVASDGSSVAQDRHTPVRFYVINTGYAILTYGERPSATLDSSPNLYFRDEDLYLDPHVRSAPVEESRLSAKMCLAEVGALWEGCQHVPGGPFVALRDGSLITWGLQSEDPAFVQRQFLAEFLGHLDRFLERGIPVLSYISYPGARDVVNSLRVWLCPRETVDCEYCPTSGSTQFCRTLAGITDRELFGFLAEGQRSDVFGSKSAILDRYALHRIEFFYMNVGGEVVRMEAPRWVTGDGEMLGLAQASIFDQCLRSGMYPPYPPALQEAHEQAVIPAADRQAIEVMVERALAEKGFTYLGSAKASSKRRRAV
jgi:hypothetical protein